jgi:DNA-binding transcriptional MerR regulator
MLGMEKAPMPREERYLIGELAERAGVNRETLRYYERRGLLTPTRRTESGYRVYGRDAAARLSFIKRAQGFGFSLDEIGDLLTMKPESPRSCTRVMTMLDDRLEDLARRIREMKRFHRLLAGYRNQCDEALAAGDSCPVIMTVSHTPESETRNS